jgi:hypothetical protein
MYVMACRRGDLNPHELALVTVRTGRFRGGWSVGARPDVQVGSVRRRVALLGDEDVGRGL